MRSSYETRLRDNFKRIAECSIGWHIISLSIKVFGDAELLGQVGPKKPMRLLPDKNDISLTNVLCRVR